MPAAVDAAQIVNRNGGRPPSDIKRKFFDTIGIVGPSSSESSNQDLAASSDIVNSRSHGVVFQEKLKFDRRNHSHHERLNSSISPKPCRRQTSKKGKSLTFKEVVEVVPIPMRNEYSTRVRSRLWSSAFELHENAVRNTIEFASEGYVAIVTISVIFDIDFGRAF